MSRDSIRFFVDGNGVPLGPRTKAGRELLRSFEGADEQFTRVVVQIGILAIEAEMTPLGRGALEAAARAVIKAGVSNRSGDKYAAKVAAFNALDRAVGRLAVRRYSRQRLDS